MARHTMNDYPPRQADKWLNSVREFFQGKNLIYSLEVDRSDDMENTDMAEKLLLAMSAGTPTLSVYVTVRVYNARAKDVMGGFDLDVEDIRYYTDVEDGNYVELIEFERYFEYE